jgi:hypothetical protein
MSNLPLNPAGVSGANKTTPKVVSNPRTAAGYVSPVFAEIANRGDGRSDDLSGYNDGPTVDNAGPPHRLERPLQCSRSSDAFSVEGHGGRAWDDAYDHPRRHQDRSRGGAMPAW